jgi:hypothetical protein
LWIRCLREIDNFMKKIPLIFCLICLFSTFSFSQKPKKKVHKKAKKIRVIAPKVVEPVASDESVNQGICGSIIWKSGNLMPSPDHEVPKPKGVQRELFVYELANTQQATLQNGFYKAVVTNLVKSVKSDVEGKFCLALPEGKYSLFVKEGDKGLYANQFDGDGNIFPVKVTKDNVSMIVFTIDYQANY